MVSKTAEKVPGWVGKFLIPEIERVVDQRVSMLKETMDARFKAVDARFESVESRFASVDSKFISLEKEMISLRNEMNTRFNELDKRIDVIQRVAILEAQVKDLRERQGRT